MAPRVWESIPQYTNVRLFIPRVTIFSCPSPPSLLHKKAPRRQARGLRTREAILAALSTLPPSRASRTNRRLLGNNSYEQKRSLCSFWFQAGLQLATIEAARMIFIKKVTARPLPHPGVCRALWGLVEQWLILVEKRFFPGGCFFSAASFEFDSRRGVVRDRMRRS